MLGRPRFAERSQAPVRSVFVGLASIADRDLTRFVIPDGGVIQDFSLVLVLGMRLDSFARAGARSVRRCARTKSMRL
jgi:hypothetical protein